MDALQRRLRSIIQAEVRSYDHRTPRTRWEAPKQPLTNTPLDDGRFACAHEVMLYEPCVKCNRTLDDCVEYRRLAMSRIAKLLERLNGKA